MSGCIPSSGDISSIGVRAAVYAQNLLNFLPALYILSNNKVRQTEIESLETQSSTFLITAFALLITTIEQARAGQITSYGATVILNLSWINSTGTLIYLLLYVYRRASLISAGDAYEVDNDSYTAPGKRVLWRKEIIKVLRNPVLLIGSAHLSLMAGVGIRVWSYTSNFGIPTRCSTSPSLAIFGVAVPLSSPSLRTWSLFIYGMVAIPIINLAIPAALFVGFFWVHERFFTELEGYAKTVRTVSTGLILQCGAVILLIVDTEAAIIRNAPLLDFGDDQWTFAQTIALLLLLVPLCDFSKTVWERRPKQLGRRLLEAARKGEAHTVRTLLDLGTPVDLLDSGRQTPLQIAAKNHHMDVVSVLAHHGANVKVKDSRGRSLLHTSSQDNQEDLVRFLVKAQIPLDVIDDRGCTALLTAARDQHWAIVRYLVDSGADPNICASERGPDGGGATALICAVMESDGDLVQYLIDSGANPNIPDPFKGTPLACAVSSLFQRPQDISVILDIIDRLLVGGARVDIEDMKGTNSIQRALDLNSLKGRHDPLHVGWSGIQYIFEKATSLNDPRNERYRLALLSAAKHGNAAMVKFILQTASKEDLSLKDVVIARRVALAHGHHLA